MEQYRYSVDYYSGEISYDTAHVYTPVRQKYNTERDWSLESLAEDCADDWFYNHDGWDVKSWAGAREPLTFYIWLSENHYQKFEIWVEVVPQFSAYKEE